MEDWRIQAAVQVEDLLLDSTERAFESYPVTVRNMVGPRRRPTSTTTTLTL